MRIIRVFPRHTSFTPVDPLVFSPKHQGADPGLWRPEADEVHISVTFTWDVEEGERLAKAWRQYYPVVRVSGPAYGDKPSGFTPGMYVKPGVTFTTRGCNRRCPWCLVPTREGKLCEIDNFAEGYIIQDNNLLQASREHIERVFAMLRRQRRAAVFSGGLDARLVDDWVAEQLCGLRIGQVFLAADTKGALRPLERALKKLAPLGRHRLRVYVLLAFNGETIDDAAERLEAVWQLGAMPFAQLYQPPDRWIAYAPEWKHLARTWSRPAAMMAAHAAETETKAPTMFAPLVDL